jgi:hypothetical protein
MSQRVIGLQRDRSPVALGRLFALAGAAQGMAKVDMRLG